MASLIISAGNVPAAANPSGLIGLSAVNGVAATWERSDSTHALDQSIVPTWTGAHTFTPSTSVVAATFNAASGQYAAVFAGNASSGNSFGPQIIAGTTSADYAFNVVNHAATQCFFRLFGDTSWRLGIAGAGGNAASVQGSSGGNVTIAAPASGQTLGLTGVAAGTAVMAISTAAQSGSGTITIALTDYPGTNVGAKTPKYIPILLDGSKYWIQALPD